MSTSKHPDIPDVPFILDLTKDPKVKAALEFIYSRQAWGRPFLAPPGVPADRAKALQDSFMAVTKDPAFVAEVNKQKLEMNPVPGPQIAALIAKMHKASLRVVNLAREATDKVDKIQITKVALKEQKVKSRI